MALKYIRDNLKSLFWILWIVIGALVLLIFFGWGGFNQRVTGNADAAAVVGDETISFQEFRTAYQNNENQYRQMLGGQSLNDDLKRSIAVQSLDQLINRRILEMEARAIGLQVADQEVVQAIVEHPAFQRNGGFIGGEEYSKMLRRARMTEEEFESDVRSDLLVQKLYSALRSTVYLTDADVEKAYRDEVESAKIRYVELPASQMDEVELTREDLEAYLAEHADEFEIGEQRVVEYLLVDTAKLRSEITISEQAERDYYDGHPDEFQRKEQVRARHILRKITPERPDEAARADAESIKQRLAAGESFADLAKELSEDPGSATAGGVLRPFGRGEMLPAFEEAAFNSPPGEVIGPVKTSFGYHLIEVLGRTPAGAQPFEEVRARINATLKNTEVNRMAETKARDLAGRIAEDATEDDLRALAEEEGLTLQTTEPFGENDPIPGLGFAPAFNQAVFELTEGGFTEPIKIPRGWAIGRLREVKAPHNPTLDEVEDDVRRAATQERKKDAAVARLASEVDSLATFDEVASKLGLEVKESAELHRGGTIPGLPGSENVVEAALGMEVGGRGAPVKTRQGAVLFEVTERSHFDAAEYEKAKAETREKQEEEQLQETVGILIAQRRRELVPQYGAGVLSNFGMDESRSAG